MTEGTARWLAVMTTAVLALAVRDAHADVFDPTYPAASLNAQEDAVLLLPGAQNAIARTEMITGSQSIVLPFMVPIGTPHGTVTVSLVDLGWPGLMSSLSFSASTSTSLLAQLAAPGSMTFDVEGSGAYFATVYGIADPNFGIGLYSLNLSYSPVPLPGAAWLLLSGVSLLAIRRRASKEAVTNAD